MTAPPPDGYSQEELLSMELPSLGTLRAACEKVAQTFVDTARTLTPMGNPMDTCRALRAAADAMAEFACEHGRYFDGVQRVQADPHKAWLAEYEQRHAKKGRAE